MKKPTHIVVYGVPCEVLEWRAETGIIHGCDYREPGNRPLAVAPDGSLFLAYRWPDCFTVSVLTPNYVAIQRTILRHARRGAK